jgi:hypothetical protein
LTLSCRARKSWANNQHKTKQQQQQQRRWLGVLEMLTRAHVQRQQQQRWQWPMCSCWRSCGSLQRVCIQHLLLRHQLQPRLLVPLQALVTAVLQQLPHLQQQQQQAVPSRLLCRAGLA